jgi:hypothetical protein
MQHELTGEPAAPDSGMLGNPRRTRGIDRALTELIERELVGNPRRTRGLSLDDLV